MLDLPGLSFDHGDDIAALRDAIQQFAAAEIAPRAEAIDRSDDITTHFFQQSFSGATNRFRIVDHHDLQTLGMLFHVCPTIASVSHLFYLYSTVWLRP